MSQWNDPRWAELERVIIRLREQPRLLLEKAPDFKDGLNAAEVNRLVGRTVIDCESLFDGPEETERWVIVHHPDGIDPVRCQTWARRYPVGAPNAAQLQRMIDHLAAWQTEGIAADSDGAEGEQDEDLAAIIRRHEAEEARRETERQQAREAGEKWAVVADLMFRLEHFHTGGTHDEYATLLVQYCRAIRAAGGSNRPPDLTPANDAARYAVKVLCLALEEDHRGIVRILDVAAKAPAWGAALVTCLLDLLHRMRGTRSPLPGSWVEADPAAGKPEARQSEGAGNDQRDGPILPDDVSGYIEAGKTEQRERDAQHHAALEQHARLQPVREAFIPFFDVLSEHYRLRHLQNRRATDADRHRVREKLADAFVTLGRFLEAQGLFGKIEEAPSLDEKDKIAHRLYRLGKDSRREELLALLRELDEMSAQRQSEVWGAAESFMVYVVPFAGKREIVIGHEVVRIAGDRPGAVQVESEPPEVIGTASDPAEAEQSEGTGTGEQLAPSGEGDAEPILYDKHRIILIALLELGAVSANKRVPLEKVLQHYNRRVDSGNYKREASSLGKWKLVNSKSGPGGGIWLTVKGKQFAERIRNDNR